MKIENLFSTIFLYENKNNNKFYLFIYCDTVQLYYTNYTREMY